MAQLLCPSPPTVLAFRRLRRLGWQQPLLVRRLRLEKCDLAAHVDGPCRA